MPEKWWHQLVRHYLSCKWNLTDWKWQIGRFFVQLCSAVFGHGSAYLSQCGWQELLKESKWKSPKFCSRWKKKMTFLSVFKLQRDTWPFSCPHTHDYFFKSSSIQCKPQSRQYLNMRSLNLFRPQQAWFSGGIQ